jgi:hypothetical protein
MGIDHAELFRRLPAAIGFRDYRVVKDKILIEENHRSVHIRYSDEKFRCLGAMRLPITRLEFRFAGYGEDEIDDFLLRFDLYFRRGGG